MRIAIDATIVREPLSGVAYAVRAQTLALLKVLDPAEVTIFAGDPILQKAAAEHGCPCLGSSPQLQIPLRRILWQQFSLPRLLQESGVDLFFAPAYTMPLRLRLPAVLQVHDTIGLDFPALCRRRNALSMQVQLRRSMNLANQIIVSTDYVAARVLQHSKHTDATVHKVPLAVDDIFREPETPPLPDGLAELQPYILFVGNIEPKKGIDTLIDAYARTSGEHKLVIVGQDGWKCRSTAQRLASYTGPGRIKRLGYVPRATLPALYAHAATAVLPSIVEGFGLPVVEAMAMGTPVVHSDHPALLEVGKGYGHIFPVGDAPKLAVALETAVHTKLPEEAIGKARAQSWTNWAETLAEIFRQVHVAVK